LQELAVGKAAHGNTLESVWGYGFSRKCEGVHQKLTCAPAHSQTDHEEIVDTDKDEDF
jgi:hypothetical protein